MNFKVLILSSSHRPLHIIIITIVLGLSLWHPMTSLAAGLPASVASVVKKTDASATKEEVKIPEGLSPDEVDKYLE
ncbi:MAG: hypothetical protein QNL14_08805 [Deltaproteobacteria bacterium]|nr:hypothetical protein [Deltaproteobacteria bacterium]